MHERQEGALCGAGDSRILLVGLIVAVVAFAAPAAAGARPPVIPDDSSIDQYIPSIPGVGGDESFGGGGGGSRGGNDGSQLSPQVSEQLQASDPSGSAVVGFTEQTGPPALGGDGGDGGDAEADASGDGGAGTEGDPVANVGDSDSRSAAGLGVGLPIILGLILLGALLWALARQRSGPADS